MRKLRVKRNSYGVPILTKEEIDILGEHLIFDFCMEAMKHPQEIDVDLFAQGYLGMEQDYQYLSHCGLYLGMMVFQDADNIIVFNPEKKKQSIFMLMQVQLLSIILYWKKAKKKDTDLQWDMRRLDMPFCMDHILLSEQSPYHCSTKKNH